LKNDLLWKNVYVFMLNAQNSTSYTGVRACTNTLITSLADALRGWQSNDKNCSLSGSMGHLVSGTSTLSADRAATGPHESIP